MYVTRYNNGMTANENPYQSPLSSEPCEVRPEDRRSGRLWLLVPVGLVAGSIFVGLAGAIGAALLFTMGKRSIVAVAFVIGGMFGVGGGGLLGAAAGLTAGLAPVRLRRRFIWTYAIMTAIYGGCVGMLGGAVVDFGTPTLARVGSGALIGGLAGFASGLALARLLAWISWDQTATNWEDAEP
jgi:hypothetical protein